MTRRGAPEADSRAEGERLISDRPPAAGSRRLAPLASPPLARAAGTPGSWCVRAHPPRGVYLARHATGRGSPPRRTEGVRGPSLSSSRLERPGPGSAAGRDLRYLSALTERR